MEILKIISGPILGTVIGFGTNYLAIKMLFRPYNEIKIAGKRLPFTPGIIPKRKPEIAKAVGNAVGKELFTKEDIQRFLSSKEMEDILSEKIINNLKSNSKNLKENIISLTSEESYISNRISLKEILANKIQTAILNINLEEIIVTEAGSMIKEQITNPLVKMFLNDDMIASFASPIGKKIENYIETSGYELIENAVENEIVNLENMNIEDILEKINLNDEKISQIVRKAYQKILTFGIENILNSLDISKIVEDKINRMDVRDLEELIMKIMKKELNAIVNLGGLLGFLLGLINIIFVL